MLAGSRVNNGVVLSIVCDEPEGRVRREVRQMTLSIPNMREFWLRAREHRTLFGEEILDDFSKFVKNLVVEGPDGIASTGLFWVIDDFVGVYYLTDIVPEDDALVHYTFFDGRHRGRAQMTKQMIAYVFRRYNFIRLTAQFPLYVSPVVFKFAEQVGFKLEGRKRKAALYKGLWFDENHYGILREEALND